MPSSSAARRFRSSSRRRARRSPRWTRRVFSLARRSGRPSRSPERRTLGEPLPSSRRNLHVVSTSGRQMATYVRGWTLIQAFYALLLGVSGIALLAPSLETREGRWGVGLALANLTLVLFGSAVTWFAYRRGERWAWWLVLVSGLCYGLPMTLIDHV